MSLKLADLLFTGPFPIDTTEIRTNQIPVIYAVIAKGGASWDPVFRVVDIEASPDEGIRLADHPSRPNWTTQVGESIGVYLFNTPRSEYAAVDRERLAAELRQRYNTPAGLLDAY